MNALTGSLTVDANRHSSQHTESSRGTVLADKAKSLAESYMLPGVLRRYYGHIMGHNDRRLHHD